MLKSTELEGAAYQFEAKMPLKHAIPLGLQHVFAMFVGNLTPLLIITSACGIAGGEFADLQVSLLQNAMFVAGIVTLVQLYSIGPIGGQVPMSFGQGSNGSGTDPANLLQQFGPASDNSLLRVRDPKLGELFTEGASCTDKTERQKIYQDMIRGMYESYHVVPVCVGTVNFAVRSEHTSFASSIDTSARLDPTLLTD